MPRPFVAYLRVYEPLSAFHGESRSAVERALRDGPLDPGTVGDWERELWLRSQTSQPRRLLPLDGPDGADPGQHVPGVLVLDPEDVAGYPSVEVGPGPLVCPQDVRARAAAGLVGFLGSASPPLLRAAVDVPPEVARARATAAVSGVLGGAVHVVTATWRVPLPWFALVRQEERQVVLTPLGDANRRVCWRVPMLSAVERAEKARQRLEDTLGTDGPAALLRDTSRWLDHFDPGSAVELDYGGLVQLLDDDTLIHDTSAADVQEALAALGGENPEEVAIRYEKLRDFWTEVATRERLN
ncbi:hypothetical protein [Actinoalloteichus spitiensis]|uniref:hypothetical protein n=1 Tax=Actinoalloteichus spitiensis TaxID=252394 RepID=UPI00037A8E56|nr:hypothetical protein [Actinoalloteichus spitiensis]